LKSTVPVPRLNIAVGVILEQSTDKVLVARRPEHVHLGGLWEFPGGKIQSEESVPAALERELQEELHITVKQARPLIKVNHDYPEKSVQLDVWLVSSWSGTPVGREGQKIRWVDKGALAELEFPVADRPIITAVNLPSLYGITPDLLDYDQKFLCSFEKLLASGLKLVQFRNKGLDKQTKSEIIKQMFELCSNHHCRLLVNGIPDQGLFDNVHGVHLSSSELLNLKSRPLSTDYLIAASCHNSQELEHAARIGVDFAVLSPVNKTATHPEVTPLGWDGFADLVEQARIPVYALGGMRKSDIDKAQSSGGQGVAMIRGLWKCD